MAPYVLFKSSYFRKLELFFDNQSMIVDGEHLYILCGTNSTAYNSNVYDIHLSTLSCTQIGFTFEEIEETFDNGRSEKMTAKSIFIRLHTLDTGKKRIYMTIRFMYLEVVEDQELRFHLRM